MPETRLVTSDPAPKPDLATIRKQVEANPLAAAPAAIRHAVWRLWTCHRHLQGMDSSLSLAATVGVWIREFGLRTDDAAAILKSFLAPARMSQFRFGSDLMTALAAEVKRVIDRRREEAETERRRRRGYQPTDSYTVQVLRELLEGERCTG